MHLGCRFARLVFPCQSNNRTSYDENTKITAIEKEAFSEFDCLKKVVIPNGICEIKDDAFKDSKNITEIYIAPSVNKIAKTAFDGIDNLTIYAEKGSYAENQL